jgi:aldehyde dehydrogenase (NAD+)
MSARAHPTLELVDTARVASAAHAGVRRIFGGGTTLAPAARRERLRALDAALVRHEPQIFEALSADLGRPPYEAYGGEIGVLRAEIDHVRRSLGRWMRPERVRLPLRFLPGRARRRPEPRGAVLILAPWNFPLALSLGPLVGALAAGCTAVLKPSEHAPASAEIIERCVRSAFGDEGGVEVLRGGADVAEALLDLPWGLVFFTGSSRVGRSVMAAAARTLTPVCLELGGKCPVIVDDSADLTVTARRIAWGKFYNAGQTCAAPDYVLVSPRSHGPLVAALAGAVQQFYGPSPRQSPHYGRVVNADHVRRLARLLEGAGRIVIGGEHDVAERYFAPTVVTDVAASHPLLEEEIFGPILPVVSVPDEAAAVAFVTARPTPLSMSVFARDSGRAQRWLDLVPSGGALVNDVLIQLATETLAFGGLGASGVGAWHGKAGFDAFTHWRSLVTRPFWLDLRLRYPPYPRSLALLRRLFR